MSPTRILVALALVGCTAPDYGSGHLECAANGACPSGYYCADDNHCWRDDSGPADVDLGNSSSSDDLAPSLDLAADDLAIPPSTCATLTGAVVFCDGFESPLATSGWGIAGSNGTPSLDTSRAYRGAASLHSHIDGAPAMASPLALIHRADIFPISGTIYARVWVYFSSGLPDPFDQFLNFADNVSTGYSIATDQGKVALNDYTSGGPYMRSATAMPLDRWACVQFDVQQANSMGAIHVSVDGQLLADLPQMANTTNAVNFSVGLDFYGNTAAIPVYDAWFDELIIDDKPTTCDE
ncbi:MAG TPA: hypothetical protein VGL86_05560 [Polyangia bacterium]